MRAGLLAERLVAVRSGRVTGGPRYERNDRACLADLIPGDGDEGGVRAIRAGHADLAGVTEFARVAATPTGDLASIIDDGAGVVAAHGDGRRARKRCPAREDNPLRGVLGGVAGVVVAELASVVSAPAVDEAALGDGAGRVAASRERGEGIWCAARGERRGDRRRIKPPRVWGRAHLAAVVGTPAPRHAIGSERAGVVSPRSEADEGRDALATAALGARSARVIALAAVVEACLCIDADVRAEGRVWRAAAGGRRALGCGVAAQPCRAGLVAAAAVAAAFERVDAHAIAAQQAVAAFAEAIDAALVGVAGLVAAAAVAAILLGVDADAAALGQRWRAERAGAIDALGALVAGLVAAVAVEGVRGWVNTEPVARDQIGGADDEAAALVAGLARGARDAAAAAVAAVVLGVLAAQPAHLKGGGA